MSINERKHASVTETPVDFLTADQQSALTQFKTSLGAAAEPFTDYTFYRFLKFNNYNVSATETQWKKYLAWRTENNIDSVLNTPPKSIETIDILSPYAYHHFDKENRPVYWEKTGKLKCDAVSDPTILSQEDFFNSHIWGMEFLARRCHEKSVELGRRIDLFTSVLDMDGLGFQHKAVISILKGCMDIDNQYYPERIGKLYVLNAPWVAPALYQLVTPILPAAIKERVFVVKGDPKSFLAEQIDSALIPVEYGGSCTCNSKKGGCVPELDATELLRNAKKVDGLDVELVKYEFVKELQCEEKGATFTWFFECEEAGEIDFGVSISDPTDSKKPVVMAKQVSRCTTSKGSYEAPGAAKLTFKWDNNFSWVANKTVRYNVDVVPNGGEISKIQTSS